MDQNTFPLNKRKYKETREPNEDREVSIHILIRNDDQKEVVKDAFEKFSEVENNEIYKLSFTLLNTSVNRSDRLTQDIEHLIIFEQNGDVSAVDIGEAGDEFIKTVNLPVNTSLSSEERQVVISHYLNLASKRKIPVTLIASQSPYDVIPYLDEQYKGQINNILVAFDASIYWDAKNNQKIGKGFQAIVSALIGRTEVLGKLPVKM